MWQSALGVGVAFRVHWVWPAECTGCGRGLQNALGVGVAYRVHWGRPLWDRIQLGDQPNSSSSTGYSL